MKKQFLVLGLAVAAMTSCTNDEVLDVQQPVQKSIGFEGFVNKGTRTVTETTDAFLQKFYVFGYYGDQVSVFTNTEVNKTGNGTASSSEWGYAGGTKYWTKNNYYFAAYADGNNGSQLPTATANNAQTLNTSFSNAVLSINNYEVTDAKDLIADVVNVNNSALNNSTVGFTFKHLLSKVQFQIRNTSSKYKMRIVSAIVGSTSSISGFTITDVKTTGDCTVTENGTTTWTPNADSPIRTNFVPYAATDNAVGTSDEIFDVMTDEESTANIKATDEFFIMPQNPANISYTIRAQFLDGANQVVAEKELNGTLKGKSNLSTLEAGYFYTYMISLPTADIPINFKVTSVPEFTNYGSVIELNTSDNI